MNFSSFLDNPGIAIIMILVIFAIIALIAFLIRNVLPTFKNKEEPKEDEETIVRKEIERKIVIIDKEKPLEEIKTAEDKKPISEDDSKKS